MSVPYKLHKGDCLPFMRAMESQSVDFTFYDPPYNVGKDYGVHKDSMSPEDYKQWMIDIASEARRLSRHGFAVYVGSKLTKLFFEIIPDAHFIPVHKRAIGAMDGNYFLQYHSLFVVGKPVIKCKDLWDDIRLPGEGYYFREERFDHPGQTAQALVKKVLYHFTVENDIVLDPFLGVGTSAIVALSMERQIVGCEISPVYFSIAESRVQSAVSQPVLFARNPTQRAADEGDSPAQMAFTTPEHLSTEEADTQPALHH